jgi:hypothetical protein
MSTLKTTNLQHASAASPAIVLASDGTAAAQVSSLNDGPLSGTRNRIINGDMRIDQRNAGGSVTPTATAYTLDRFRVILGAASKLSVQRDTTAPAGFSYSAKITVASSYTPAASEQFFFGTTFEADNVGDLEFGTAGAVATTLSFWVRSSATGTYSVSWTNDANNRSYIATYTINVADTWEYKTIVIPGDTTGTWVNAGNGRHSFLQWSLGSGSDFHGTAGSWQASNVRETSGSVDFVSQSNGATFYITGVQLEAGTVATPFERRSYGQELALCQRYYQQQVATKYMFSTTGQTKTDCVGLCTEMRATPTVTKTAGTGILGSIVVSTASINSIRVDGAAGSNECRESGFVLNCSAEL